jgi:hypothetical protein
MSAQNSCNPKKIIGKILLAICYCSCIAIAVDGASQVVVCMAKSI